jgi:hypothetical protein
MKNLQSIIIFMAIILLINGCSTSEEISWPQSTDDCESGNELCLQQVVSFGLADENVCEKINTPNIKNMCFVYAARNSQNPTTCDKIDIYEDNRDTAYNTKILCDAIARNQHDKCKSLQIKSGDSWGNYWEEKCLNHLAQLNRNALICDSLDEFNRAECYVDVANILDDISICNKLPDKSIEGKSYTRRSQCKIEFNNVKKNNYPNWLQNIGK